MREGRTSEERQIDHDLLIELRTEVRGMRGDIKDLSDNSTLKIADHEVRLRRVEQWGAIAIGGLAVLEIVFKFFIK